MKYIRESIVKNVRVLMLIWTFVSCV